MRRYLRTSIRESAKIVDMHTVVEQPNVKISRLAIYHLTVRDHDEIIDHSGKYHNMP